MVLHGLFVIPIYYIVISIYYIVISIYYILISTFYIIYSQQPIGRINHAAKLLHLLENDFN